MIDAACALLLRFRDTRSKSDHVANPELDLPTRPRRSSALPWRGQFTPELVTNLLLQHTEPGSTVCDPFAGSGSTLFIASEHAVASVGADVSPAAFELAKLATLVELPVAEREAAIHEALRAGQHSVSTGIFGDERPESESPISLQELIGGGERGAVRTILAVAVMISMGDQPCFEFTRFNRALSFVAKTVRSLSPNPVPTRMYLCDARSLPLNDGQADFVVTSPPYINVFNYHHNYRHAVEQLGWEVLRPARSEIGANRKHRQNRFMTVVQYPLDMCGALSEMSRVVGKQGEVVLVVGRESNVLGTPLFNSELVAATAVGAVGMEVRSWRQRRFRNKFGKCIVEDVLTLRSPRTRVEADYGFARDLGRAALEQALRLAPSRSIEALAKAIEIADCIDPSPRFDPGSVSSDHLMKPA